MKIEVGDWVQYRRGDVLRLVEILKVHNYDRGTMYTVSHSQLDMPWSIDAKQIIEVRPPNKEPR